MEFNTTITVLFENKHMVAIDKPAGCVVHADGKTHETTIVDWIVNRYGAMEKVGEPWETPEGAVIPRPGIVHRLDRGTSGVLLIAKTQEGFDFLKKQFQERSIAKTYAAFVYGVVQNRKGVINFPIGKSQKDFRLRSAQHGARGALRDAVTEYAVLAHNAEATYLEAYPKTGRTHQLRAHFKAIHHPIVCDTLYAPKRPCILGFKRLALHARALALIMPSGERLVIEAPFPQDFENAQISIGA